VIVLEQQRLAALHEYCLLDAPAGDELEAVVRVAAMVAGVPTATLNLIDENRSAGEWRITVAHNGVGIPPDQRRLVFEMFAQVDRTAGTDHDTDHGTVAAGRSGRAWRDSACA
jgi:hypothetical protein